jgi:methionine biosynthesis protein MetW
MVQPGSLVLDIGCGDGDLLAHIAAEKGVDGRGIEIKQDGVNACVARGLSVIQGDADQDLGYYPDNSFDYAILSLTLQATKDPRAVLLDLVRIGRRAIVSFPNFGHWRVRTNLLLNGRMPTTPALKDTWYQTQNIHLCTIRDFLDLTRALDIRIETGLALDSRGGKRAVSGTGGLANLFGETGLFLLSKG